MSKLIQKIRVVITSAPAVINGLVLAVTIFSPRIAEMFPQEQENITKWTIRVLAFLAGSTELVRRLTPVPKTQRGILPQYQGQHFAPEDGGPQPEDRMPPQP